MAIALVQRATAANNNAATLTVDIATPTSGNLLVAVMFTRSATLTNPSGFTTLSEYNNTDNADWIRIAYKVAGGGEADPQWSGLEGSGDGFGACSAVYEFSGTDATPADASANGGAPGIGVLSRTTGTTATLAQADEVCIGAWGNRDEAPGSPSFGNSYTIGPNTNPVTDGAGSGPAYLLDAYRIVSATTAQECTATWTDADQSVISCIATFKEGAGGGATIVNREASRRGIARGVLRGV